jgi:hypothetical protein
MKNLTPEEKAKETSGVIHLLMLPVWIWIIYQSLSALI